MYSFSLKPRSDYLQPFGYINFTDIDNKSILVKGTFTDATITVYAINYNLLLIENGKCFVKYFN